MLIGLYMCKKKIQKKKKKLNIVPQGLGKNIYLCINEQMNCNSSQYNKLIWLYDYCTRPQIIM